MTGRLALVAVALVGWLGLIAGPASAHTTLQSASPAIGTTVAPPSKVVLTYADPVHFPELVITDAGGHKRGSGKPQAVDNTVTEEVAGTLGPGVYTVGWRVVAPDGHPVTGQYRFIVRGGAGSAGTAATAKGSSQFPWWWVVLGVLLVAGAVAGVVVLRRTAAEE
jgi:methionine-rich copper-binding protein CopC